MPTTINRYTQRNVITGDNIYTIPSFNGNGTSFTVELDASLFTRPGRYVLFKSTQSLVGYVKPTVVFVGSTSLKVKYITPSGGGDLVSFSDGSFYCILAEIS